MPTTNFVFDLIDPALLIEYVRAYNNEVLYNQFALEAWLPNEELADLEYRVRTGTWKDVDVALFRSFDTPAPMTGRQGFGRMRGELAPVSRQIPLGEEEMLRLRALERGGNNQDMINAIYADSERMIRAVQARIELARGQVLYTGKLTLAENGLSLVADFGMPSSHKPVASVAWTDPTALAMTDLLTWLDVYNDTNGILPGSIMMSRNRVGNLLVNQEFRTASMWNGVTPPRINQETLDAVLSANGIPPIITYDTKVRINGVATRVIPEDYVIFLPPQGEELGRTFYGITAEAIVLASKGYIDQTAMPGIVAVVTAQDHPVATFTVGTAIAMPVMPNPQLVLSADVLP